MNRTLSPFKQARILDMLLTLPEQEERIALLPDCFTPPPADQGEETAASGFDASVQGGFEGQGSEEGAEESDELWCTSAQLLNELDARLRQMREGTGSGQQDQKLLGLAEGQLAGEELEQALQGLRVHVNAAFLQAMRFKGGDEQTQEQP